MTDKDKLTEILNNSFAEQYEKRGLLTAPHTADDLIANGVICESINNKKIFNTKEKSKMENKKVIIRAEKAGVFFGTLKEKNGNEVVLNDCRRLWYWDGASSISQLAKEGTVAPHNCKFTVWVDEITILGVIEIIPCTEQSIKSIEGVKEWKR